MATRTFEKVVRIASLESAAIDDKGELIVGPASIEFRGKKGGLVMSPVRSVAPHFRMVRIDFGEPPDVGTAVFSDYSGGLFGQKKRNPALLAALRELVHTEALPPDEIAIVEAKRQGERGAQGHAKMRSGRRKMWIGGGVAIAGALVTLITYAAAEPGGRYFLFWGAVIFGVAQFFIGLAQFKEGQKASGERPLPAASKGTAPTAGSVGLADVAALKERRDVDGLVAALGVNELEVRVQAMDALAELRDPRATDMLITRLQDPRWDVRWSAAEALGKFGDQRAVEPLTAALRDENALVRAVAEASIRNLKGSSG